MRLRAWIENKHWLMCKMDALPYSLIWISQVCICLCLLLVNFLGGFLVSIVVIRMLIVTALFWGVSVPGNVVNGIEDEAE